MKSVITFSLFIFICLPLQTFATSDTQDELNGKQAEVDSVFKNWDSYTTPGCAVDVTVEGRRHFSEAYGMADLEHQIPNTTSTIFEAGSVSKQFTAAAVVVLKLEGKLSLDDDIREYIPDVPDYGETITIRHLLTHTSGLRDWGSVAAISGWGRSNRTHSHEHVLDIISRQQELNFEPGEYYSYSNSGYNLAAILVDSLSEHSFAEFSDEYIFEPLGMNDTEWRNDYTRIVEGRSSAYTAQSDSFSINRPIEHVHGNGGLLTTVSDLNTWNEAMRTGRLAGQEFVELMHKFGVLNNGRTINYALGLREGTDNGVPFINHTGATSGYRAFLGRYPEQELSVALLCNVTNASPGNLGSNVAEIFLGDEAKEEENDEPVGIELTTEQLNQHTGLYKDPRNGDLTELIVENDTLQTENGTKLTPESENEFRVGTSDRHFIFQTGDHVLITVEGYEEGELHEVEEFNPGESELKEFTGTYFSEDAETQIRIEKEEDKLILKRRPDNEFELEAAYTDAFSGNFGKLRFRRDENGEINKFLYGRGRVYSMPFELVDR